MLVRKLAAVAMAASVALGTAGCTFLSPIATQNAYQPGDGANSDLGDVSARNLVYLVGSNNQGALIGSLINEGTSDEKVSFVAGATSYDVSVAAGAKVDFGYNGANAIPLGITSAAGSTVQLTMQVAGNSTSINLPVLDGTFSEYAGLVSNPTPTATPKN